jgi:hypothetical protein
MLNCQQDCFAGDYTYIHTFKHRWVYRLTYTTRRFFGRLKKYWWREHFPIHEIGRIDGGRGFWTGGNMFQIGGNTFYDRKIKIPVKIPEFKRSGIGITAEFRGIPSGFSNQALSRTNTKLSSWRKLNSCATWECYSGNRLCNGHRRHSSYPKRIAQCILYQILGSSISA